MTRRLQHSLFLLGILLGCLTAVATGTAAPEKRPAQGYSRLLTQQADLPADQGSLVEDCLMEGARLRQGTGNDGAIPVRQFEELRTFCRQAVRFEHQPPNLADPAADAREHTVQRQRLRDRHRQAMRELGALAPRAH